MERDRPGKPMEETAHSTRKSRTPSPVMRALLPVLLVLIMFLVVEGACRLLLVLLPEKEADGAPLSQESVWQHEETVFHEPDPDLFWRMIPSFSSGTLTTNPDGFRGPDLLGPTPPETFRVVLMGNSVTFGYKVGESETYATRLHEYLESAEANACACGNPVLRRHQPRGLRVQLDAGPDSLREEGSRAEARSLGGDVRLQRSPRKPHDRCREVAGRQRDRFRIFARKTGIVRLVQRFKEDGRLGSPVAARSPRRGRRVRGEYPRDSRCGEGRRDRHGPLTVAISPDGSTRRRFPAVSLSRGAVQDTVWMRQIDFATGWMDPQARGTIMNHFFFGGDLSPFTRTEGNCTKLFDYAKQSKDLPIYLYLLANCFEAAGLKEKAVAAMNECRRLDTERMQMEAYKSRLRLMAEESGVRVLDMAAVFAGQPAPQLLFLDAIHPTASGHDLIARTLRDSLFVQGAGS